jgi:DNA-directed RNA polymerase subunit RPC12/RpoP
MPSGRMKMDEKCPGQDSRNLQITLHKCEKCGNEVELFSDETKAKCRNCGEIVYREKTPAQASK